jgi:hypothetical protein
MPPAEYSITAAAPGFQSVQQTGVVLLANQAETVNIELKLGAANERVTVWPMRFR